MLERRVLECRLLFEPGCCYDQRLGIADCLERHAFAAAGVAPARVVFTFGSVLFQVALPPEEIAAAVFTAVPCETVTALFIDGRLFAPPLA